MTLKHANPSVYFSNKVIFDGIIQKAQGLVLSLSFKYHLSIKKAILLTREISSDNILLIKNPS